MSDQKFYAEISMTAPTTAAERYAETLNEGRVIEADPIWFVAKNTLSMGWQLDADDLGHALNLARAEWDVAMDTAEVQKSQRREPFTFNIQSCTGIVENIMFDIEDTDFDDETGLGVAPDYPDFDGDPQSRDRERELEFAGQAAA